MDKSPYWHLEGTHAQLFTWKCVLCTYRHWCRRIMYNVKCPFFRNIGCCSALNQTISLSCSVRSTAAFQSLFQSCLKMPGTEFETSVRKMCTQPLSKSHCLSVCSPLYPEMLEHEQQLSSVIPRGGQRAKFFRCPCKAVLPSHLLSH